MRFSINGVSEVQTLSGDKDWSDLQRNPGKEIWQRIGNHAVGNAHHGSFVVGVKNVVTNLQYLLLS